MTIRSRGPRSRRLTAACLLGAAVTGSAITAVPATASPPQAGYATPGAERIQASDFTVRLYIDSGTAVAGEFDVVSAFVIPVSQTSRPVSVTLSTGELPPGVTVTFDPPTAVTGRDMPMVKIFTSPTTPAGIHQIPIIGTGSGQSQGQTDSALFRLTVQ